MLTPLLSRPSAETPFFSALIKDYLAGASSTHRLVAYPTASDLDIPHIIAQRQKFPLDRKALHAIFLQQHQQDRFSSEQVRTNMDALLSEQTFSICTAHQPHLAMGPMYVLYKIAHTILWAKELKHRYPNYNFVPIFFIGSEDADKGELLELYMQQQSLRYPTRETGAVGRMTTAQWTHFREVLHSTLPATPFKDELLLRWDEAYQQPTMTAAFRELVSYFFSKEGLLMMDIDDPLVKQSCLPLFVQEIEQPMLKEALKDSSSYIQQHYQSVQFHPSDCNLFHLQANVRKKIHRLGKHYVHPSFSSPISSQQYVDYITQHPETVSPNAVLRALAQEYLLPNVAFVGGGGELAYWLQLKAMFEQANVHFPYLALRHSVALLGAMEQELLASIPFSLDTWMDSYPWDWKEALRGHLSEIPPFFPQREQAYASLRQFHGFLSQQGYADERQLNALEAKLMRFYGRLEQRKHKQIKRTLSFDSVQHVYDALFPFGKLQERTFSVIEANVRFGMSLADQLLAMPFSSFSTPSFTIFGTK